ncbi:MAG: Gfo/Idh/MocA family protein [Dehalococcoidia bacterium]
MDRKIRMGMVGGGRESLIGPIHRIAAQMDNQIELVAGAFSSTAEKSMLSGRDLLISSDRIYDDFKHMIACESALGDEQKVDFISIVTPNNFHYDVAKEALSAGFHVVCDKPITMNLDQALRLEEEVNNSGLIFCLTYNYTGYPMVKEARQMILNGDLGLIRKVVVEYPQGWLADAIENVGNKQAAWRSDPAQAGPSSCMGDIGTHCANLAEYITGLSISEVCADLTTFVSGRQLDDDGSVLLRFNNGAKGILWASQVAIGMENALKIRIYAEKGTLEWAQEEPNSLWVRFGDRPAEIRRTATDFVGTLASSNVRLPAGHPEGYIEAFANIYRAFAEDLSTVIEGTKNQDFSPDYPNVRDGVRGMYFINAVVKSLISNEKWIPLVDTTQ